MRRSGPGRRIDGRPTEPEGESSAEIARQISRVGCYAFLNIRELWYLTNSSLSSGEPLSAKTVLARLTASPNAACATAFPLPGVVLQARYFFRTSSSIF